jgi:hypothetical protein
MSFSTGDSELTVSSARIEYEKNVTADDILREAGEIYAETRRRKIDIKDHEAIDKFAAEMRRKHKQFAEAYPIVLRYITQLGEYHPDALRLYLTKIQEHPWKDEDSYLRSQTDYVILLYKAKHKRWNATQVANLRENIYQELKKEKEKFKEYSEKFEKEVQQDEEQYKLNRARELQEFLDANIDKIRAGLDLTPHGVTDIPTDDLPEWEAPPADVQCATADDLLA